MGEQSDKVKSRRFATLTIGSLAGLIAGLIAGIAVYLSQNASLISLTSYIEPFGVLWTNSLRMVVLPLVISSLIVGIASVQSLKTVGRLGGLSLLTFISLLTLAAIFALITVPPLIARLPVNPVNIGSRDTGTTSAESNVAAKAESPPAFAETLTDLVPTNPFKAAADGAILPLIVFVIPFALAITQLKPERNQLLVSFFQAISDATLILVRWILWAAPVGIFALTFSFIARTGFALVGSLAYYVAVACALLIVLALLLYAIAVLFGRVSLPAFAQALAPAQLVAISSRSSLACLPALIEGAEKRLRLAPVITGFVLPFAVSTFKVNRTLMSPLKFLFLARLYGIDLSAPQIIAFILMVMILSFSSAGIPSTGTMRTLPAYLAAGIPIEAVILFNAVEPIVDVLETLTNVTGHMTAAVVVARTAGVSGSVSSLSADATDQRVRSLEQNPALSES